MGYVGNRLVYQSVILDVTQLRVRVRRSLELLAVLWGAEMVCLLGYLMAFGMVIHLVSSLETELV